VNTDTSEYPRAWMLVSAAWLLPAILGAFEAWMQARLGDGPVSWRQVAYEGVDWLLYALLTPVVFRLAQRFPLRVGTFARRLPLHLVAAIVLAMAWSTSGSVLAILMLGRDSYQSNFAAWFFTTLPFGVAVYFAILGIAHGLLYLTQASRLGSQLAQARLDALRMQMHPHFLFNSLNAITVVLRDRDVPTAVRMMEQLGEVLHRVMRTDRPNEIPLRDEIEFVRQYLALETMRFSDRLNPVFDVDPAVLDAAVPDLVLQPLVENALRHGLARRSDATRLVIGARREGRDLVLWVEDDGPGPAADQETRGRVGLSNTRERLATMYGAAGRLELTERPGGGAVATVRIPWRRVASPGPGAA
jgi:two-component system LytT family sensor kinase